MLESMNEIAVGPDQPSLRPVDGETHRRVFAVSAAAVSDVLGVCGTENGHRSRSCCHPDRFPTYNWLESNSTGPILDFFVADPSVPSLIASHRK